MSDATESIYLPGAASLAEHLDSSILMVLRDGRNLVGTLRSFDQYMNLIVEDTIERVLFKDKYCDIPLGVFIVRGDNIVLLGELDAEKENNQNLKKVSPEELTELVAGSQQSDKLKWDFE